MLIIIELYISIIYLRLAKLLLYWTFITEGVVYGLCVILSRFPITFPDFNRDNAIKVADATNNSFYWWPVDQISGRLKMLNFMIGWRKMEIRQILRSMF